MRAACYTIGVCVVWLQAIIKVGRKEVSKGLHNVWLVGNQLFWNA